MSQFWTSWVNPWETTWTTTFKRKDLDIASLNCTQSENNCAVLEVVVKNPQVGLLASDRLVWLWLAWENDAGVTTPIFFGRLIPVPTKRTNEGNATTLSFLARPLDFDTQRVAAALALQVAPGYDPIFIDPAKRLTATFAGEFGTGDLFGQEAGSSALGGITGYTGDPDSVLEGWAKLWSIDRVTGAVDSSDILVGEDGTEVFESSEVPADSIDISVSGSALSDVTVTGKVNWTQTGSSSFPVTISGSAFNGLDLISGWPKAGASLAGGYKVKSFTTIDYESLGTAVVQQKGWHYENKAKTHRPGEVISESWNYAVFPPCQGETFLISETVSGSFNQTDWAAIDPVAAQIQQDHGDNTPNPPYHVHFNIMLIPIVPFFCTMQLGADAKAGRNETLTLKLAADIQPLIILPTSANTPSAQSPISINGSDVGVPIDGVAPLDGGPTASNYFPTSRGQQSIDYLMSVGIAHLKSANRCVSITWATTFERAIALSCRKSATINCRDIPGGTATGKIVSYGFSASGPNLQLIGTVTIACCIGNGGVGTTTPVSGSASYAVAGTFVPGLQVEVGATVIPGGGSTGDTSYTPPIYVPQKGEPQFPLQASQCIVSAGFTEEDVLVNLGPTVNQFTGQPGPNSSAVIPISVFNLELLNLSGSFGSVYDLTSTPLKLPKQIDLTLDSW